MEITTKDKKQLVKEFNEVFNEFGYEKSFDDESHCYTRIKHPKTKYFVHCSDFWDMAHFIRCIKNAKEQGLNMDLANPDFVMNLGFLFSMLTSIRVYDGINLDTILTNRYIQNYEISNEIKLFFAEYVRDMVENIRYAFTDSEGVEYNTHDYKKIY